MAPESSPNRARRGRFGFVRRASEAARARDRWRSNRFDSSSSRKSRSLQARRSDFGTRCSREPVAAQRARNGQLPASGIDGRKPSGASRCFLRVRGTLSILRPRVKRRARRAGSRAESSRYRSQSRRDRTVGADSLREGCRRTCRRRSAHSLRVRFRRERGRAPGARR